MGKKSDLSVLLFLIVLVSTASMSSASYYDWKANEYNGWTPISGNYVDAANWDMDWTGSPGATPPTITDDAGIDEWAADAWINSGDAAVANNLQVGIWEDRWGPPTLNIDGGTLDVTWNLELGIEGYNDWGAGGNSGNYGYGIVNQTGGYATVDGLTVGDEGVGEYYLLGGTIQAEWLWMGTPTEVQDADGSFDFGGLDNVMNITGGKLLLAGDISSLDSRVVAYGGGGSLVFEYEADLAGYTTITAIPEPATMLLLGLGSTITLLRKRK